MHQITARWVQAILIHIPSILSLIFNLFFFFFHCLAFSVYSSSFLSLTFLVWFCLSILFIFSGRHLSSLRFSLLFFLLFISFFLIMCFTFLFIVFFYVCIFVCFFQFFVLSFFLLVFVFPALLFPFLRIFCIYFLFLSFISSFLLSFYCSFLLLSFAFLSLFPTARCLNTRATYCTIIVAINRWAAWPSTCVRPAQAS